MKTLQLTPVPEGTRWPSGDSVDLAILPISEEELSARIGLPLVHSVEDGLGPWAGVGGLLPSGVAVEFIYYLLAPGPRGIILRVDKGSPYAATLDETLRLVRLSRDELLWTSPLLVA